MATQPTGTVTLLFTDVEGSTRLLHQLGQLRYAEVRDLHRRLLRAALQRRGGYEVDCEGEWLDRRLGTSSSLAVAPTLAGRQPAGGRTDGVAEHVSGRGSPAGNGELQ